MIRLKATLVALALVAGFVFAVSTASASTPASGSVTVPSTVGQTATDTWTGSIPPGSNGTSDCAGLPDAVLDHHMITVTVPAGIYSTLNAQFSFSISWTPGTPTEDTADEILTVIGPDGNEVGSSDGGSTTETVAALNLPAGTYDVEACGFVNALPQPYDGKLEITTLPAVGVNAHYATTSYTNSQRLASLDKMKSAGIGWVRIDLDWAWVQPTSPSDWNAEVIARADFAVDSTIVRGLKVLLMVKGTPSWACSCSDPKAPPTVPGTYGTFMGQLATYFGTRVAAYEVWNEPNPASGHFFGGSAADYAALVRASYAPIKTAVPAALVVAGASVYNDDVWLGQVFTAGIVGYFDVISTHPYQGIANQPPDQADDGSIYHLTHVPSIHNLMTTWGVGDKPIWFTEFGWSDHSNNPGDPDYGGPENWNQGVTQTQQADYLTQAISLVAATYSYVTNIMWYEDRNEDGASTVQNRHYGLLYSDLASKPAYSSLVTFMAPACTITGTAGNDTLNGTAGADVICGLGGNDVISAGGGNDKVFGGDGDDWIAPGLGGNYSDGGAGSDTVSYSTITNAVAVNLSNGTVQGEVSDTITGFEKASGSPANDTLTGDTSANNLAGLGGDDVLNGGLGDDTLVGGAGNDQLNGSDGVDYLQPGDGNDVVNGGLGTDTVSYLDVAAGVTVNVGTGQVSGAGSDSLVGIENAAGSNQADILTDSAGSNSLYGWAGNDALYGLDGSDWLNGGDGTDTCFDPQGSTYVNCEA